MFDDLVPSRRDELTGGKGEQDGEMSRSQRGTLAVHASWLL